MGAAPAREECKSRGEFTTNRPPTKRERVAALAAREAGGRMRPAPGIVSTWRRAVCSPAGPESPTTRYLLLALAARMEDESGCARSESQLAEDTGLVKRSVITHLQLAEEDGWIARRRRRPRGRLHQSCVYEVRFPPRYDGNVHRDEVNVLHPVIRMEVGL